MLTFEGISNELNDRGIPLTQTQVKSKMETKGFLQDIQDKIKNYPKFTSKEKSIPKSPSMFFIFFILNFINILEGELSDFGFTHYCKLITDDDRILLFWGVELLKDVDISVVPEKKKLRLDVKVQALRYLFIHLF